MRPRISSESIKLRAQPKWTRLTIEAGGEATDCRGTTGDFALRGTELDFLAIQARRSELLRHGANGSPSMTLEERSGSRANPGSPFLRGEEYIPALPPQIWTDQALFLELIEDGRRLLEIEAEFALEHGDRDAVVLQEEQSAAEDEIVTRAVRLGTRTRSRLRLHHDGALAGSALRGRRDWRDRGGGRRHVEKTVLDGLEHDVALALVRGGCHRAGRRGQLNARLLFLFEQLVVRLCAGRGGHQIVVVLRGFFGLRGF
ncbi:MAG TPA: hypothetical protein VM509_16145, partial [Planctomycetota bacterium]|nr:hypothetical protein [Planctomycetota bacterium]